MVKKPKDPNIQYWRGSQRETKNVDEINKKTNNVFYYNYSVSL